MVDPTEHVDQLIEKLRLERARDKYNVQTSVLNMRDFDPDDVAAHLRDILRLIVQGFAKERYMLHSYTVTMLHNDLLVTAIGERLIT